MSAGADAETLALFLDATRQFLAQEVDPAAIESEGRIPPRVIAAAGEAGLFALTLPAAHGGLALSLPDACAVIAEVARVDRSVAIMVGLHAGLGTRALVRHGTAAQHRRWLPALSSGACVASFGATEPDAGSDLQAIRTVARVDGDHLRVDGAKAYVTNGGFAGLFTLLVRTPDLGGERAHSLLCVPRETPGLHVGPEEDKLGVRASSTVTLTLGGVKVPRDHLLGTPGEGMALAHETLAWGRVIMAAGCVGTARFARDATVAHVTSRRQFRRDIASFDGVRSAVADLEATLFAMRALTDEAARALERGDDPAAHALSTAAKVFCSEGSNAICDQAVQLHGAMGFLETSGVPRALRDTRITRIFEGANDVLLIHLGALILGRRGGGEGSAGDVLLDALDARRADVTETFRVGLGVRATQRQGVTLRLARAEVCAQAARAARRLGERDEADARLAGHAVAILTREGHRHLDALRSLDVDEESARAVSDRAYAEVRGVKVRFVYPRFQRHADAHPELREYVCANEYFGPPSLGIASLAAVTPPDWEFDFRDDRVDDPGLDDEADLVAISCFTPSASRAMELADAFRARGRRVVMGGIFPTMMPEVAGLHCDAVVEGEGELAWQEVLADARAGALRPRYVGRSPADLSQLPLPRLDLYWSRENDRYHPDDFPVQTTRGCPLKCDACVLPTSMGRAMRHLPVEHVMGQIRQIAAKGRLGSLTEDTSFLPAAGAQRHLGEVLDAIAAEGVSCVSYIGVSMPMLLATPAWLWEKLARAGVRMFYLVGGFDPITRKAFTGRDPEAYRRAVAAIRRARGHGIDPYTSFLVGNEDDDEGVFDRMLAFCDDAGVRKAEFAIFTPYPGTPAWHRLLAQDRILHRDWSRYNDANVVFRPAKMSPERLLEGYLHLWREFFRARPELREGEHAARTVQF